ncbi:MAG TPA: hypothetical protein VHO95_01900 [Candidatus Dormibacteraeota bacterium]|jgi:hypothetical protein|nr:hypothetical protein [Candidatus Dormibacteraeota bacterium]HEX2681900.1 hypothetical protein [Candidatus Dormibacteraeota bacterium]
MNPYLNEEMAWQRLNDLQREAENSRLWRHQGGSLLRRAWTLAGLAMRRPPRFSPRLADDRDSRGQAA